MQGARAPTLQDGVKRLHGAGALPAPPPPGVLGQARGQRIQLSLLPLRTR